MPLQLGMLGAIFVAMALLCDSIWALVAGTARDWFAKNPKRISRMSAAGGGLTIGLAVAVLVVPKDEGCRAQPKTDRATTVTRTGKPSCPSRVNTGGRQCADRVTVALVPSRVSASTTFSSERSPVGVAAR